MSIVSLIRASDLLYLTVDKLGQLLTTYLQNTDPAEQNGYLNLTKMILYLEIGLVRSIDQVVLSADGGTKKSGRKQTNDNESNDWDLKRYRILVQIYNFIQLPLEKLWSVAIAEEDFVK